METLSIAHPKAPNPVRRWFGTFRGGGIKNASGRARAVGTLCSKWPKELGSICGAQERQKPVEDVMFLHFQPKGAGASGHENLMVSRNLAKSLGN